MRVKAFLGVVVISATLSFAQQSVFSPLRLIMFNLKFFVLHVTTNVIADGSFVMNGVEQYVADINFEYNAKITNYVGEYNLSVESLFLPWLRGYGNVKDAQIAYSLDEALFTCKTFTTLKALHVKNNIEPKEANDGAKNKVA